MIGHSITARLSMFMPTATVVTAWLVPAILFALVVVASWVGVRWAFSQEMSALRSAPLFKGLSTRQLRSILSSAAPTEFSPGAVIVKEGEASDAFFIIKEGSAKVFVEGNERATLGPRSYFGEISVIDGGPRTATVTAQTKVSALQLTSRGLTRTLERYPSIARLMFLKLRALLQAEGDPVPPDDVPVDHSVLVDLCQRLRKHRDLDWSPAPPSRRRTLLRR